MLRGSGGCLGAANRCRKSKAETVTRVRPHRTWWRWCRRRRRHRERGSKRTRHISLISGTYITAGPAHGCAGSAAAAWHGSHEGEVAASSVCKRAGGRLGQGIPKAEYNFFSLFRIGTSPDMPHPEGRTQGGTTKYPFSSMRLSPRGLPKRNVSRNLWTFLTGIELERKDRRALVCDAQRKTIDSERISPTTLGSRSIKSVHAMSLT